MRRHAPSTEEGEQYARLRDEGVDPGRAARVSGTGPADAAGGEEPLERRTLGELRGLAARAGIHGRSRMRKAELVAALGGRRAPGRDG